MDGYKITLASSAEKEIAALQDRIRSRIIKAIDSLKDEPRPRGTIKLKGKENLFRRRVGDYRVLYTVDDENRVVDISYVRHRNKAY
ncbi:type II toxin-antitoxin system RelE/ParE family toxin [bacterium]|nr:MAG: type II toxin-antitoxin system RelE/ParE family toxin [bacterium]